MHYSFVTDLFFVNFTHDDGTVFWVFFQLNCYSTFLYRLIVAWDLNLIHGDYDPISILLLHDMIWFFASFTYKTIARFFTLKARGLLFHCNNQYEKLFVTHYPTLLRSPFSLVHLCSLKQYSLWFSSPNIETNYGLLLQ